MVSNGKNGVYNLQDSDGGLRGAVRTRRGMQHLQRDVEAGKPGAIAKAQAHADAVLAAVDAGEIKLGSRAHLRAIALMTAIGSATARNAVDLDKMERLEHGDATDRVESREVTVTVPKVGRLSDD